MPTHVGAMAQSKCVISVWGMLLYFNLFLLYFFHFKTNNYKL